MLYELYGVRPFEVDLLTDGELDFAERIRQERAKKRGG